MNATQLWAWAVAVIAAVVATLCAAADGALLVVHAKEASTASAIDFGERERRHRALSMARVLAYVGSGAAIAQALRLAELAFLPKLFAIAAAALVVCVLAEGVGRAVGNASPIAAYPYLTNITRIVYAALAPAVALGAAIDRALHGIIPPPTGGEEHEASTEQFREVVAAEADVSVAEEALLHGVFTLGETEVQEIMVPRVDIVGIDVTTPWSEALDRVRSSEHSRVPVFRDTLDEVVGILYAKDILPAVVTGEEPEMGWGSLVRPPSFIPTSKRIDQQLREFQASRTHIAIVSDEYGGTAGLVTIEDILEEIVGEIRDEYDDEEAEIRQEGAARYWVSGRVSVDELSERLGTNLEVDGVTTVGGLAYSLFGRVPAPGETVVHSGFRIIAERVRRRRIERVYFERLRTGSHTSGDDET